jgi:hypothetical protein
LDRRFLACTTAAERCELARAGLANLLLYLGWLRSSEAFTAPWSAFDVVDPCDAATVVSTFRRTWVKFVSLYELKPSRLATTPLMWSWRFKR